MGVRRNDDWEEFKLAAKAAEHEGQPGKSRKKLQEWTGLVGIVLETADVDAFDVALREGLPSTGSMQVGRISFTDYAAEYTVSYTARSANTNDIERRFFNAATKAGVDLVDNRVWIQVTDIKKLEP